MDKAWTKEELLKIMENDSIALKDLHDAKKYIHAMNEFGPGKEIPVDKMSEKQREALDVITKYHEDLLVKLDIRIQHYENDIQNAHYEYVRLCKEENNESNNNDNGQ